MWYYLIETTTTPTRQYACMWRTTVLAIVDVLLAVLAEARGEAGAGEPLLVLGRGLLRGTGCCVFILNMLNCIK